MTDDVKRFLTLLEKQHTYVYYHDGNADFPPDFEHVTIDGDVNLVVLLTEFLAPKDVLLREAAAKVADGMMGAMQPRDVASAIRALVPATPAPADNGGVIPMKPVSPIVGAFTDVLGSLVAAVSLLERGGKQAASSNKMFAQMLKDYKVSVLRGRDAYKAYKSATPSPIEDVAEPSEAEIAARVFWEMYHARMAGEWTGARETMAEEGAWACGEEVIRRLAARRVRPSPVDKDAPLPATSVPEPSDGERTLDERMKKGTSDFAAILNADQGYIDGVKAAAKKVAKRRDGYVEEHGSYDPDTGVTEFPGTGEEYVGELDEIEEEIRALLASRAPPVHPAPVGSVHILFDGPPSHESGRFVEVENDAGASINIGEWVKRADDLWDLVIPYPAPVDGRDKVLEDDSEPDYFGRMVLKARKAAAKASIKFPQPNYVTLKIAEEAGEVVRGAVHYAEGRTDWAEVEGEVIQLIAMLIRFVTEGDQVNGVTPPALQTQREG